MLHRQNPTYSYVMSAILSGMIAPGEKLSEPQIAKELNISRAPVREALRQLQMQGLVTHTEHQGMRVIKPSLEDHLALLEVRETLEGTVCRLAAVKMSADELKRLERLIEDHSSQVRASKDGAYLQTDVDTDFHIYLARASQNPVLAELLCNQLYPRLKLCRLLHTGIKGRGAEALKEHVRIFEALAGRDSELAELMMKRHIVSARRSLELASEQGVGILSA